MPVTDIRLLITFKGHRKRKKLKMMLGAGSTDYLIDLWLTAANDRSDGVLTGWDKYDIAIAAGWEDEEPDKLVDALIKSGWLDYENEVFSLHDWFDHQGWAYGANKRSEAAKKAALARWRGQDESEEIMRNNAAASKNDASAYDPHSSVHAAASKNDADSQKSDAPSPSPLPSLSLTKVKPDKPVGPASKNNNHFSNRVGRYKKRIVSLCKTLDEHSKRNGKRVNAWAWVQQKASSRGHPQAIIDCLEYVVTNWESVTEPWGFMNKRFVFRNPKYSERQHIEDSKQFKKLWLSKEMRDLVGDVGKRMA